MASKYAAIWNELKRNGRVAIAMHPAYHSNLVRMMSVEKDRDVGFKIALGNTHKKAVMTKVITGARVEFKLTLYYLNGIPVINLEDL